MKDEVEEKIKELTRLREEYFEKNPMGSVDMRQKMLHDTAINLIQCLSSYDIQCDTIEYLLLSGRILNETVDYEEKAEEYLSKAVKLDPDASQAWLELGLCLTKKPNIDFAIECFESALRLDPNNSLTMSSLSMAIRSRMTAEKDFDKRFKQKERSMSLARSAVAVDPCSSTANACYANALLLEFFATAQCQQNLLNEAISAYRDALKYGDCKIPDVHLNIGTALRYDENFAEALEHLRKAVKLDPSNEVFADDRVKSLTMYLQRVADAINKKGKLKPKRLTEMISSLNESDGGSFIKQGISLKDGTMLKLKLISFDQLIPGRNKGCVTIGRVVATVSHDDVAPLTLIVVDSHSSCLAVTIYNCTQSFGYIIGDSIAIAEPFLIETKNIGIDDSSSLISFRSIRCQIPSELCRNGSHPNRSQISPMTLSIGDI